MTASISTDLSYESANEAACQRLGSVRRFHGFWIMVCLLGLPGCSGCQKVTVETPTKPETVAAPPADPEPDAKPIGEPARSDTGSDSNNQSSSTSGSKTPGAPRAGSKSSGSGGGPKVEAGTRPLGETKSGTAARKPSSQPQTADAALKVAQNFQQKSAAAEKRGDYGKAYDWASQAWEAVHTFPQDAQCETLTSQLETQLESLGDRANALASPGAGNTKRLVDQ